MEISEIHSTQFAKEEYSGFEHTNIEGQNLLIHGGNRTGKTLTFNAILYNLLGPRETIDLSTGRKNNVSLMFTDRSEFRRGKQGAMFRQGNTELEGDNAQEKLAEWLAEDISSEVSKSKVIKNHFIHTHIDRMPLSRLSDSDRLDHIRAVVDKETQEDIEETEKEIENLQDTISSEKEDLRRAKEDKDELENSLSSDESQLEKYEQILSLIESGELSQIVDLLKSNIEVQEKLSELSRKQEFLRQRKASKQKEKRQWERYRESERHSIIAEAVNDFVCPACSGRVDGDLAETRLSRSRCPFCAVEGRSEDLEADVDDKISRSEEELEEIEEDLDEINSNLDEVNQEMEGLHEEEPELGEIDGRIERVIRENDYDVSAISEETDEEIDRYRTSIEEHEEAISRVSTKIEDLKEDLESHKRRLEEAEEELIKMREESIEAEIDEFTEEWGETFQNAAGEIGLEIRVTQDGDIEIPGNEGPRKYDRAGDLSDAEITFMNITFAVTYNRFAQESEVTEWSSIVCDEPFSNLDSDGVESLLEFIDSCDEQFICTSSEKELLDEFPKTGQLTRQTIQASLGRFA